MDTSRDTQTLLVRQPEACRMLGGISKHTLRQLVRDGRLDAVVLRPGGWPRITRASIERLGRGEEADS